MSGEESDESSGLSHLSHAAANIMFEIERRHGSRVARGETLFSSTRVDVTCPRCRSKDTYPLIGVYPCTDGCGYFIEPELMKKT
jgi:hypothetical protein